MEPQLEPYDGPISTTRHPTSLSRTCEGLITTFLRYQARQAVVNVDLTGYDIEELYMSLYSMTRRKSFKHLVQVHKQDGKIILIRKEQNNE